MPKDYLKIRNKFITKVHIDMQQIIDEMTILIKLDNRIYKQIGRGEFDFIVPNQKATIKGDDLSINELKSTLDNIKKLYHGWKMSITHSLNMPDMFVLPEYVTDDAKQILTNNAFINLSDNEHEYEYAYQKLKVDILKVIEKIEKNTTLDDDNRCMIINQFHILLLDNFYRLNQYYFPTIDNNNLQPEVKKILNLFLFNTIFEGKVKTSSNIFTDFDAFVSFVIENIDNNVQLYLRNKQTKIIVNQMVDNINNIKNKNK
jgi:hypothetical protein